MSLKSMLGAIAQTGIPPLVLEQPRLDRVAVHTCAAGLRVEVSLALLGLVPLGDVHATARFAALLERSGDAGCAPLRRTVESIEAMSAEFRRSGLGHARAELELPTAPPLTRLVARMGPAQGTLVKATWSDLIVWDPAHRLLKRITGEWTVSAPALEQSAPPTGPRDAATHGHPLSARRSLAASGA